MLHGPVQEAAGGPLARWCLGLCAAMVQCYGRACAASVPNFGEQLRDLIARRSLSSASALVSPEEGMCAVRLIVLHSPPDKLEAC